MIVIYDLRFTNYDLFCIFGGRLKSHTLRRPSIILFLTVPAPCPLPASGAGELIETAPPLDYTKSARPPTSVSTAFAIALDTAS